MKTPFAFLFFLLASFSWSTYAMQVQEDPNFKLEQRRQYIKELRARLWEQVEVGFKHYLRFGEIEQIKEAIQENPQLLVQNVHGTDLAPLPFLMTCDLDQEEKDRIATVLREHANYWMKERKRHNFKFGQKKQQVIFLRKRLRELQKEDFRNHLASGAIEQIKEAIQENPQLLVQSVHGTDLAPLSFLMTCDLEQEEKDRIATVLREDTNYWMKERKRHNFKFGQKEQHVIFLQKRLRELQKEDFRNHLASGAIEQIKEAIQENPDLLVQNVHDTDLVPLSFLMTCKLAQKEKIKIATVFLEYDNCDVEQRNSEGAMASDLAVANGEKKVAKFLLNHIATLKSAQ